MSLEGKQLKVWSYNPRVGKGGSTITVLRVENVSKIGVVIDVRINGIQFGNCTGGPTYIQDWAAHRDGAYTISVTEMVKLDDSTFNAGFGCSPQADPTKREQGRGKAPICICTICARYRNDTV